MATLLLVTNSIELEEIVRTVSANKNNNIQVFKTSSEANNWMSLNAFDVLLADDNTIDEDALEFLRLCWEKNPNVLGVIINAKQLVRRQWEIMLAGGIIFHGTKATEQLKQFITDLQLATLSADDFSIMMVEDLDAPREIICTYIKGMGYPKVEGVADAKQALSILTKNPSAYNCVITDINMPEISGAELTEQIRQDPRIWHLPIIVLTAYATPENLIDCVKFGATGFLVKPPRKQALKQELEKARRLLSFQRSPRICSPEDAHLLEDALIKVSRI